MGRSHRPHRDSGVGAEWRDCEDSQSGRPGHPQIRLALTTDIYTPTFISGKTSGFNSG